jgi:pimeloyl-ACP methyl ester carboxylesterase
MRIFLERSAAGAMDAVMCLMMNRLQWRLRHDTCTSEEFLAYLDACESLTREAFYAAPAADMRWSALSQRAFPELHPREAGHFKTKRIGDNAFHPVPLHWPSPVVSGFAENDTARALWFVGPGGPSAPTAIVLHALMSASDIGYRRLAAWFHARGWNMLFPHLPFHYSRTPRGHRNGALAITAHLPRNAESLRQGVTEQRQAMAFLRAQGVQKFGLLGTSYGGWTAALLSFVEADFEFLTLIQPIIDIEHAIWESPAAASIRRILTAREIGPGLSHRHAHLSSPLHGEPLTARERITLVAGSYDTVSPASGLRELAEAWAGVNYVEVRQGHFGYAALEEAKRRLEPFL